MKNSKNIKWMMLTCIITLASFFSIKIYAQQAGTLDSSFGNNGVVYCETNYELFGGAYSIMDIQGRILSVSNYPGDSGFVIIRHTIDGLIDTTFGVNGSITFYPGIICGCYCVQVDFDNRLLAAGYIQHIPDTIPLNYGDFFVARFLPNGNIDSTFGTQGYSTIDLGQHEIVFGMTLQNDSLILLSGGSGYNIWGSGNTDVALIRLLANGNLDSAFGSNEIVLTDITSSGVDQDFGYDLATQPDGKILQTATNGPGINASGQLCLLRYEYNGLLDSTFANNGIAIDTINFSFNASCKYIGLKNDGSIIVACNDGDVFGGGIFYAIRQFTSSGFLDSSFANNGILESVHSSNGPSIQASQLQSDNKLITLINKYDTITQSYQLVLSRLSSQGVIDAGFGTSGTTLLDLNNQLTNTTDNIYLKPVNKITLLGVATNYADTVKVFIVRYHNDIFNAVNDGVNVGNQISIYPNPANDLLTISYPQLVGKEITTTITDIAGKIVYQTTTTNSEKLEVSTNDFSEGMYMVQVMANGVFEIKKVIVAK